MRLVFCLKTFSESIYVEVCLPDIVDTARIIGQYLKESFTIHYAALHLGKIAGKCSQVAPILHVVKVDIVSPVFAAAREAPEHYARMASAILCICTASMFDHPTPVLHAVSVTYVKGKIIRLWIFKKGDDTKIIGCISFNLIVRGIYQ